MATLTHNQWANDVTGKYVNVDGAYGGQCWDTFADYCRRVLGISPINTHGGKWHGWAYAIWDQYETNGASAHFDKISPDQPARQGDTVIWTDKHWAYPASHIAIVLADAGANVLCMSQNSSPAQPWLPGYSKDATGPNLKQYLTKQGLAGYLRPKSGAASIAPVGTITQEEDDMFTEDDRLLLVDALARISATNANVGEAAARVSATNENVVKQHAETRRLIKGDIATVHTTIIRDVGSQLGNIQAGVNEKVDVDSLALELAGKLEQRDLDALVAKLTITVKEA